jgi:hypothetical protein
LRLLILKFLRPNGYTLAGETTWDGDQSRDSGVIYVSANHVEAVSNTITNAGPSWCRRLPEPRTPEIVRSGRGVIASCESGDLPGQIRRPAGALDEFVEIPKES